MSGTATIIWTNPTPSNTQELYYGKDALVTGLPGSGTGWTPYSGNPFVGTIGSVTIDNLDDNVKYNFLVRGDCAGTADIYSRSSGLKWVCGSIQITGPTMGSLTYNLIVDPSVSNSGSTIGQVVVSLTGVDRTNGSVVRLTKTYAPPFNSTYTDVFTNVIGNVDWTLRVSYKTSTYPNEELYSCSSETFSTTVAPSTTLVHVRNALNLGTLAQVVFGSTPKVTSTLDAGYGANVDISALVTTASPIQLYCTLPTTPNGTQLVARQIRNNTQIAGGTFTYIGSNSAISSIPWTLQNGDIVEITDSVNIGYIYNQVLATKVSTPSLGYSFSLSIDIPQGGLVEAQTNIVMYDYATGVSETIQGFASIPAGQVTSAPFFLATTLTTDQYNRAAFTTTQVLPTSNLIGRPYYYT